MLIIPEKIWNEIKIVMSEKKPTGRPPHDVRIILSGVFYVMTTGAQWRCLPDYCEKPITVHGRFRACVKLKIKT